jgi:hypothetical protein
LTPSISKPFIIHKQLKKNKALKFSVTCKGNSRKGRVESKPKAVQLHTQFSTSAIFLLLVTLPGLFVKEMGLEKLAIPQG